MFGDDFFVDLWNSSYSDPCVLSESEERVKTALARHVQRLAGEIGERNNTRPRAFEEAAQYIEGVLRDSGLPVRSQAFMSSDGFTARNIEAILPGSEPGATLVIGAHYDTIDCAGANDNASGVAALLEIATALAQQSTQPKHTLRLVAFANEEPPYFGSPDMGSWVYAQRLKEERERLLGMVCLETVGYYTTDRGSQQIPHPLSLLYHNDIGNFIAFCSNPRSKAFLQMLLQAFRRHSRFPSEGLAVPLSLVPDLALSDNMCFWEAGFSAVMVTDTVYLRYRHYHQPTDTADKLNYDAFARVTWGLTRALGSLAMNE